MENFYYKKAESLDKTPIILRMERRRTINTNEAEMQEEKRKMFARAVSISSLDRLTGESNIPRGRSRDLTKSLSENVVSSGRSKGPKVITEAELSSSWLYKAMQESVNARFKSPNKPSFPQIKEDLEPIKIKDPKMKPILVKPKGSRKNTCCCRFLKIAATTIITLGITAVIAGIIYMQVFANKDLSPHETSDVIIDLSKLNFESREDHEEIIKHDLKSEEDLESIKNSFRLASDRKSTKSPLTEIYDQKKTNAQIKNTEKSDSMELDRYLSNPKTKIRFQDDKTVIYEVKSNTQENSNDFKGRTLVNFNDQENDSLNNDNGSDVISDEKLETEMDQNSNFGDLKDRLDISRIGDFDAGVQESDFPISQRKYVAEKDSDEINQKGMPEKFLPEAAPVKNDESEVLQARGIAFKIRPNANVFRGWDRIEMIDSATGNNYKSEIKHEVLPSVENFHKFDKDMSPQLPHEESKGEESLISLDQQGREIKPGVLTAEKNPETKHDDQDVYQIDHKKGDHDVDLIVEVIEDPEEETTDYFISARNGDIFPSKNSPIKSENESFHSVKETGVIDSVKESRTNEPQMKFREAESLQPFKDVEKVTVVNQEKNELIESKPVDLKASLANAMKHLQILDVNNRILNARMRTKKPSSGKTKQEKQSFNSQREELEASERMKYLQKVRRIMYDRLQ